MKRNSKNRDHVEAEKIRLDASRRSLSAVYRTLDTYNDLLRGYEKTIRELQEIGHGSLLPHLYVCKDSGCLGCLHVRWKRWVDPQKEQKAKKKVFGKKMGDRQVKSAFIARDVKNPLMSMPRGDENEELRETIKAFESVRQSRKDLVRHLSNAMKCVAKFKD